MFPLAVKKTVLHHGDPFIQPVATYQCSLYCMKCKGVVDPSLGVQSWASGAISLPGRGADRKIQVLEEDARAVAGSHVFVLPDPSSPPHILIKS